MRLHRLAAIEPSLLMGASPPQQGEVGCETPQKVLVVNLSRGCPTGKILPQREGEVMEAAIYEGTIHNHTKENSQRLSLLLCKTDQGLRLKGFLFHSCFGQSHWVPTDIHALCDTIREHGWHRWRAFCSGHRRLCYMQDVTAWLHLSRSFCSSSHGTPHLHLSSTTTGKWETGTKWANFILNTWDLTSLLKVWSLMCLIMKN